MKGRFLPIRGTSGFGVTAEMLARCLSRTTGLLPQLPRQSHARGIRPAGRADPHDAARRQESSRGEGV